MRLIKSKNDLWIALAFIGLFLAAVFSAIRFMNISLVWAATYLLTALLLYWPIRLILESLVSLVSRLIRR